MAWHVKASVDKQKHFERLVVCMPNLSMWDKFGLVSRGEFRSVCTTCVQPVQHCGFNKWIHGIYTRLEEIFSSLVVLSIQNSS